MALFGFHKKEKQSEEEEFIDKFMNESLGPVSNLARAIRSRDVGEMVAAASKKMKCPACHHDFLIGEALTKSEKEKIDGFDIKCPKCGNAAFSIA